jgi:hypothetical protein
MKNIYIIIFIFVMFILGLYLGNRYSEDEHEKINANNKEILLELRSLRDSLLTVVESYDTPDVKEINNYYTNKYENEIKTISSNNVDSNIVFFANWYLSVKQRD